MQHMRAHLRAVHERKSGAIGEPDGAGDLGVPLEEFWHYTGLVCRAPWPPSAWLLSAAGNLLRDVTPQRMLCLAAGRASDHSLSCEHAHPAQVDSYVFIFPDEAGRVRHMLLPLLDLINHRGDANSAIALTEDGTAFVVAATKDIRCGERPSCALVLPRSRVPCGQCGADAAPSCC
jgi:hypothetical protein